MTLTEKVARAICAHYETDIDKHWPAFEQQAGDYPELDSRGKSSPFLTIALLIGLFVVWVTRTEKAFGFGVIHPAEVSGPSASAGIVVCNPTAQIQDVGEGLFVTAVSTKAVTKGYVCHGVCMDLGGSRVANYHKRVIGLPNREGAGERGDHIVVNAGGIPQIGDMRPTRSPGISQENPAAFYTTISSPGINYCEFDNRDRWVGDTAIIGWQQANRMNDDIRAMSGIVLISGETDLIRHDSGLPDISSVLPESGVELSSHQYALLSEYKSLKGDYENSKAVEHRPQELKGELILAVFVCVALGGSVPLLVYYWPIHWPRRNRRILPMRGIPLRHDQEDQ